MIGKVKNIYKNYYINKLKKKGIKIGSNCEISRHVQFGTEPYLISIGDNVRITHGCKFFCHDGSIWVLRNLNKVSKNSDIISPIKIGNNVNFGWNVMVMPGVTVGDNVMIGAGAIITKDIPSNCVVAGIPAKVIKTIDEYYEKNISRLIETKNMDVHKKRKFLLNKFGDFSYEKK